jgi:hypothetical protein
MYKLTTLIDGLLEEYTEIAINITYFDYKNFKVSYYQLDKVFFSLCAILLVKFAILLELELRGHCNFFDIFKIKTGSYKGISIRFYAFRIIVLKNYEK